MLLYLVTLSDDGGMLRYLMIEECYFILWWRNVPLSLKNTWFPLIFSLETQKKYSWIFLFLFWIALLLKIKTCKNIFCKTITIILKILFYLLSNGYVVIVVYMYITLSEINKKNLSKLLNFIEINFFLQIFLTYLKLMWLIQNFFISF